MFAAKVLSLFCRKQYYAFIQSLQYPEEVQLKLRNALFQSLLHSNYGKHLGVKNWEDIPVINYSDISEWVFSGLTKSSVRYFVETSGSSCRSKKIPYTAELKKSFINMFKIWAFDLLNNVLKPEIGKIFLSLSPPSASGIKDDREYLNFFLKILLKPYLIVPSTNPEKYVENVAKKLLEEKDLGIISIWNPSYLQQILEHIEKHCEKESINWNTLWPKLQLISCWTEGWASHQATLLKKRFPQAIMQGKGLLATEAPMTVPLHGSEAPVPLIDEVYFEFEDSCGNIFPLSEVVQGNLYELIISQKGGLLRYRIGDQVRISGMYLKTPCLTFIGRVGQVCDMVGEKLDLSLVEGVLNEVFHQKTDFSLLLPVLSTHTPSHYILLTETMDLDLPDRLEQALQKIYHYQVARRVGQLGAVKIKKVDHLLHRLHHFYQGQGINRGDIKDTVFIHCPTQAALFLESLC